MARDPLAGCQLDRKSAIALAKKWYDQHGPFVGQFKMNEPLGAYCNARDGSEWSLWYKVSPDTTEEYFVRFKFGVEAVKGAPKWSVLEYGLTDASEEEVELALVQEPMIAIATHWSASPQRQLSLRRGRPIGVPGVPLYNCPADLRRIRYDTDGPFAGQYQIKLPIAQAYQNR